jgi:monoamine oxidase
MRMPKGDLLRAIANSNSIDPETIEERTAISRRSFLSGSLKATAFVGLSAMVPEYLYAGALHPSIAIVGGGMAGLNAAWYLKKASINATIYEGDKNTGGRIRTVRNHFGEGLTTEVGAEFIDSTHTEMLKLVKEFDLKLKDRETDFLNHGEGKEIYFIDGQHYSLKEVINNFNQYNVRIQQDALSIGDSWNTPAASTLDHLSIEEYFDQVGLTGWLRKLLDIAYTSEFGLQTSEQSALNFLTMISTDTQKGFDIYGASDERYGIVGGNAQITRKLTEKLQRQIKTNYILNAIRAKGKGFVLSFANGKEVHADLVIMTIPFKMLRDVDMRIEQIPTAKSAMIKDLGYGNNTKLILGMNSRPWREQSKAAGYAFSEKIYNGWDSSSVQNGNRGIGSYTLFVGTADAIRVANMKDQQPALATEYLPALEQVFPGCQSAFNGKTLVADWPNQPFIKASYAAYKVGQWTSIAGNEITPVGNLYFAGEHCSPEFQGFMNGAAETGKIAAKDVIKKVKGGKSKAA